MAKFEGQERRMPGINACLKEYGMNTLEDARDLALAHGINVEEIVKGVQPIAFDNAVWAYTLGVALALKKGVKSAAKASEMIGVGLQAFCVPGSVAEQRQVGLGHGIWAPCCCVMKPSASAFWQDTNPLRRRRVPSALPVTPAKPARSRCA